MSLHFARKPKRVRRRVQIALGLLVLAVVAVRLASAAPEGSTTRGLPAFEGSDPGLVHVHGIGVDPRNDGLYKAAHTGLLRIDRRGNASRVANRYQATMGFTVLGGGHFLASGHPDLRER